MRTIGFGFDKIHIERKKEIKGKLEIKTNINITEITKETVDLVKEDVLKFKFSFSVLYEPGFAELKLDGYVVVIVSQDAVKDLFKHWKKKRIPDYIRLPLFNFILTKCNIKAMVFEEEFNLPLHVPMPKIMPPQEQSQDASYVR
ncbi:MAG TPA: hypothetical protein VJA86_01140 [Candidatus Nanoarchaeia archaeon]|nr:hypothetical protein [Candidatus Nanoarchaeia archaeon]